MKYTEEQFKQILDGEKFIHFDNLPFESEGLEFFNCLPEHLQAEALQWGLNDTGFREDMFEFLIKNQFNMSVDKYYKSNYFESYRDSGRIITMVYSLLPGYEKIKNHDKIVLFDSEYNGYESFFDFNRDIENVFSFNSENKIPPEFTGKIKVIVEYSPTDEDFEQLNKL